MMKNFVKSMAREGSRFTYRQKFAQINLEKLKAGISHSSQIRKLMKDTVFDKGLSEAELSIWQSLKTIVTNFLGNHRSTEYEKEIEELLKSFLQFGVRISV